MVRRNIRLPKAVADWAEELAGRKGHASDISSYISDLIRRDKEKHDESMVTAMGKRFDKSSVSPETAHHQIVRVIEEVARNLRFRKKQS
jgi:Arc/MetJ-type ribon-helix-helix transcriptional regulator